MTFKPLLIPLIAVMLLSGCTAAPEPVAPSDGEEVAPDPAPVPEAGTEVCPLLADIDLDGLLAEPTAAPVEGSGTCSVEAADAASPASIVLQVVEGANGRPYYERDRELLGVTSEIGDLGDEAYFAGKRVNVLLGDTYVYLQILRNPVGGAGQVDDAALVDATRAVIAALR